jgi:hypothetical protein
MLPELLLLVKKKRKKRNTIQSNGIQNNFLLSKANFQGRFLSDSPYFIATLKCQRTLWIVRCCQDYTFRIPTVLEKRASALRTTRLLLLSGVYERGIQ